MYSSISIGETTHPLAQDSSQSAPVIFSASDLAAVGPVVSQCYPKLPLLQGGPRADRCKWSYGAPINGHFGTSITKHVVGTKKKNTKSCPVASAINSDSKAGFDQSDVSMDSTGPPGRRFSKIHGCNLSPGGVG